MPPARILKVVKESATAKSLYFIFPGEAKPGQFVMVWLPGVDEVPMSLSYLSPNVKGICVEKVGKATSALQKLKEGGELGVRGPYGHGYDCAGGKRMLVVSGGSGAASLAPAVECAIAKGYKATVVIGAKTASKLIFEERMRRSGAKVVVATDDGTRGTKGFATDVAAKLLGAHKFDFIITCGPEAMMAKVAKLANKHGLEVQASLERYMKCGVGLCGSCAFGRYRVCADGPVFSGKQLAAVKDFGASKLAPDGRRTRL